MTVSRLMGMEELRRNLRQFPVKYQNSVVRASVRSMAAVIQKAVKKAAPRGKGKDTGKRTKKGKIKRLHLYQTVKIKGRKIRGPFVKFTVHAGKGIRYAHLVHFGTKAHRIAGRLKFNGSYSRSVRHPGSARNPFMSRAFEASWMRARDQFAKTARAKLAKLKLRGV